MHELNVMLAIIGGLVLVVGAWSEVLRRGVVSAAMLALATGVLLGPHVAGLVDLDGLGHEPRSVLKEGARLTLAVALMALAMRIPRSEWRVLWRPVAVLLAVVMPAMWAASGLLVYGLLTVPFWVAMLVGGVVTPVDPVLAESIASGKVSRRNIPARLRHGLLGEAGANDGLAFPLVALPLLVVAEPPGDAVGTWVLETLLHEVVGGAALGVAAGYLAGRLLRFAQKRRTVEEIYFYAFGLALALFTIGAGKLAGSDGILAVFVAGVAFVYVLDDEEARIAQEHSQESVNRFFSLPIFILLGMALPWEEWRELGWTALWIALAILTLRRLPFVLAATPLLRPIAGRAESAFLGWFGPIGIAALYYATLAADESGRDEPWVVGTLVITASVLAHGVTAGPITRALGWASAESPRRDVPSR